LSLLKLMWSIFSELLKFVFVSALVKHIRFKVTRDYYLTSYYLEHHLVE